jgi:hypothetical protein
VDLSELDIMVVQIDGIHISEHLVLVAALGIDSEGFKHPLGLMEGATEHSAVVQALIDDLIERGLDPAVPRLFIIDGSKALAKAIRRSFGRHTPIQRCQIHKARNIMERLSPALHASVRRALRQAWELDDAAKAEKLIRNLAQRLERDAPGVSKCILEGLDEILTVRQARSSGGIAALAGLHQHHRKYDGYRASRHPQCEALDVIRPFNCGLLSSHFLTSLLPTRHGDSACPVEAGRGCGDGASAGWRCAHQPYGNLTRRHRRFPTPSR